MPGESMGLRDGSEDLAKQQSSYQGKYRTRKGNVGGGKGKLYSLRNITAKQQARLREDG